MYASGSAWNASRSNVTSLRRIEISPRSTALAKLVVALALDRLELDDVARLEEADEVLEVRQLPLGVIDRFSAEEGEALGVIGHNGAGKTTLLKLLSRITRPTSGVSRTRGRVGALLDVGTGFHPELTGRRTSS